MAMQTPTAPLATVATPMCHFLNKLSAELRNEIYELAITPHGGYGQTINFLAGLKPPQKSLLLTCHQIYTEAKGYYLEAYQKYWRENQFEARMMNLEEDEVEDFEDLLSTQRPADLDQIKYFIIAGRKWSLFGSTFDYEYLWEDFEGLFKINTSRNTYYIRWIFCNASATMIRPTVELFGQPARARPVPLSLQLGHVCRRIENGEFGTPGWQDAVSTHELAIREDGN